MWPVAGGPPGAVCSQSNFQPTHSGLFGAVAAAMVAEKNHPAEALVAVATEFGAVAIKPA
jgi:hypothetical protein